MSVLFDAYLEANPHAVTREGQAELRALREARFAARQAEPINRCIKKARALAKERGMTITGASHLLQLAQEAAIILGINLEGPPCPMS